jgi:hypothetical protein
MEEDRQKAAAARPTTVPLTPVAADTLEAINLILRDIGYRVKTAALIEAALVELHEQFVQGKAVEIIRRRVPPHSVVFPP